MIKLLLIFNLNSSMIFKQPDLWSREADRSQLATINIDDSLPEKELTRKSSPGTEKESPKQQNS